MIMCKISLAQINFQRSQNIELKKSIMAQFFTKTYNQIVILNYTRQN